MPSAGSVSGDRTVHAVLSGGTEVVRYDRAGKWYFEKEGWPRVCITLAEAVNVTARPISRFFPGRPGGRRFDAGVRAARRERAS